MKDKKNHRRKNTNNRGEREMCVICELVLLGIAGLAMATYKALMERKYVFWKIVLFLCFLGWLLIVILICWCLTSIW